MIRVTSGYEKSIGLEVFIKSFLELKVSEQKKIILYTSKDTLIENLEFMNLNFEIKNETCILKNSKLFFKDIPIKTNLTIDTLEAAISDISESDILVTLPSSKNQFILDGKTFAGHTEYFRYKYNKSEITMNFLGPKFNMLLITDHIPLSEVTSTIKKDLIIKKIETTLSYLKKYSVSFGDILFSGINPHCGEDGILGSEEKEIHSAKTHLEKKYPSQKFIGPLSADTIHFSINKKDDLIVSMFHDQGLALFKGVHGLIGINTTLGLPFLRVSVDHGTAPDLYGKNIANYEGAKFLFNKVLESV